MIFINCLKKHKTRSTYIETDTLHTAGAREIWIDQSAFSIVKSEKYEKFCASKLLIWHQKWTAGVRHGTSLVVRRVSSGRPIVVLFWTKYAFPRQIKPGILKLTTSRGHNNLLTVFSFVNRPVSNYAATKEQSRGSGE